MADDAPVTSPSGSGRRGRLVQMAVVLALMLVEGVAIFYFANSLSPAPTSAMGGQGPGGGAGSSTDKSATMAEVQVAECWPSNKVSGKLISFQVTVSVVVATENLERVKELAASHEARIRDRVNFVFRSADPAHFNEPMFDTIKRRIKFELDRTFDDPDLVSEVLLPDVRQSNPGL